jgi:hypothetical protein
MSSGALSLLNSSGTPLTKTSLERRALDTFSCLRFGRSQRQTSRVTNKIDCKQDLALGASMEVNAVLLSRQRELVCIGLSEFEAESLQPHPADLTVVTRHDAPFNKIVHLVPVVALGQCTSNSFRSDREQGEMLLLDKPLSLFRRNNDSSTSLVVFDYQESVWESGWGFK